MSNSRRPDLIALEALDRYPPAIEWATCLREGSGNEARQPFDLQERTARFGEAIIKFCKRLPRGPGNDRIIDQLVGAATSVGANYCEADEAVSKREFTHKIGTCKKEAKEAKFFLRMAGTAEPALLEDARNLWKEANGLHKIFCKIFRTSREPKDETQSNDAL